MQFSFLTKSFKSSLVRKLAIVAASALILPVAVACDTQSVDTVGTAEDTSGAMPAEGDMATEPEAATQENAQTIVEVASANGSFNTLVAAVQAAGLAETLSGEGPYTVFAPTDEAFAALPEGVLDQLLLPENKDTLTQILTYHVIPAAVPAAQVETGTVATVEGSDLNVTASGDTVTVNDTTVVQADVMASNGVIHVIDSVLLPPNLDLAAL